MKRAPTCLALLFAVLSARAEVKLSNLFSDHMVLQRDKPAPVWGTANPGEAVTVAFAGQTAQAVADASGRWTVRLAPLALNATPADLLVNGAPAARNVLVGDVWICSGQSNMEMVLGGCNDPDSIRGAEHPLIRRIKFDHRALAAPDTVVPRRWETCTPQSAPGFTAAGFYFARRIAAETGVPVGLIDTNWGGTRIEPWTPPAGFDLVPSLRPILDDLAKRGEAHRQGLPARLDALEQWIKETRAALAASAPVLPDAPALPNNPLAEAGSPTALFNGMIHPLVPMAIRGALWYQGEANGGEGPEYTEKMRALIGGWRAVFGQGDFPFYFVQLANFQQPSTQPAGGDGWARVRVAQEKALAIPNTGMAVIIDIGEANDIHPRNKFDVGERLARWALNRDYGRKDLVVSGPLFKSSRVDGSAIVVEFDHAGSGLMVGRKQGREPTAEVKDGALTRFAVAGADRQWVWADAKIEGATVRVSSPTVPAPVAVRYAYAMNPEGANLYNREGLPASPFRTDDW